MSIDERLESLISVVTEIKEILIDLGDLIIKDEEELEKAKNNQSPFGNVNITVVSPDKAKGSVF